MSENLQLRACWSNLVSKLPKFAAEAHLVYVANNWTWYDGGPQPVVPSVQRIETTAYSLAWQAYRLAEKTGMHGGCSSGRIAVSFHIYDGRWSASVSLQPVCSIASEVY